MMRQERHNVETKNMEIDRYWEAVTEGSKRSEYLCLIICLVIIGKCFMLERTDWFNL